MAHVIASVVPHRREYMQMAVEFDAHAAIARSHLFNILRNMCACKYVYKYTRIRAQKRFFLEVLDPSSATAPSRASRAVTCSAFCGTHVPIYHHT